MRLPEITLIKKMRLRLGVRQAELAREAGVSQSLIARLEAGKADPSYSRARTIFLALEKLGAEKPLLAKDLMARHLVPIRPNAPVREAAALMRKKNISQLPVGDHDVFVGSISEKTILEKVTSGSVENVSLTPVKEIMDEPFPQVDERTHLSVIALLLEYNSAVLVTDKGKAKGIVTRSDVLKLV